MNTVVAGGGALLGEHLSPVDDAVVALAGGSISFAGEAGAAPPAGEAELVDAAGLTLMPGFIDSHVHIGYAAPIDVLVGGVTTVRDLGWPPEDIWGLVSDSRSDDFEGPQILAAGQMLTVPGGYPTRAAWAPPGTGRAIRCAAEGLEAVAEQAESGACVVKVALNPLVGPTLDARMLGAIVSAAHDRGLRVTGHVYGLSELHKALDAGIDELAHMLMSPEHIPAATIERMVDQTMAVVPTLSCFFDDAQEIAIANLRTFVDWGGEVVYGTDLGNEGPRPGIDAREVDALSRSGLSGARIVAAATVDAARYLGLNDRGVLEPGRRADVVGVRWTPGDAARGLTEVALVWRAGRRIR